MPELSNEISQSLLLLATVVTIVVQVIKQTELIPRPERWVPLVSIVLAILIGVFVVHLDVLLAILAGATSCGIYDIGKKTVAGRV